MSQSHQQMLSRPSEAAPRIHTALMLHTCTLRGACYHKMTNQIFGDGDIILLGLITIV